MHLQKSCLRISRHLQNIRRYIVPNAGRWALRGLLIMLLGYFFMQSAPLLVHSAAQTQEPPLVTQEIRYHMPEAGEVFLVWGIDGWGVVPEKMRPAGTVVKNEVMHTPMDHEGDTFVVKVQVPSATTIDYGFLITKTRSGADVMVWEADGEQDYHTVVQQEGVIEIETTQSLAEKTVSPFPIIELPWIILVIIGTCLILATFAVRKSLIKSQTFLFIIILLVGAILRFNHITQPFTDYISWRQTSTAMMADNFYRTSWNIFYPEVSWNGPGPSYQGREFQTVSYISALLYVVLGQHDWIGRGVAVLFGLWGIFALYQLVCRVWDEERALASAAIMAILPGAIFIERSFLPDPAMVALVVTSFWILVVYFQTERLRYLILAGLIGTWGLLTKIPGLIIGLPMVYAMLAILGYKRLRSVKRLTTLGLAVCFILVPVAAYYLWVRHLALTYPPYHFAGAGNWLWDHGISAWLAQNYFIPALYWDLNNLLWTKPIIALVLLSLFLRPPGQYPQKTTAEQVSTGSPGKAPWLFHFWLLAGIIYYLIGAKELVINAWNFHLINPAAAALAGHALISVTSFATLKIRKPVALAGGVAILFIIIGFGQYKLRTIYTPQKPWDATESYKMGLALRQASQPDDLVLTIGNDIGEPVAIYYSQRRGWVFPPPWPEVEWWEQLPENDDETIRLFEELRANDADWFGIVNQHKNEVWKNHPAFVEHLNRTCRFHSETSDYIIYRVLSLEDVALLTPPQDQIPVGIVDASLITQEIRYHMPEAGEVFLVWGINEWNTVPKEMRPVGTVVKNEVMHTPMERAEDAFVAKLQVPAGVTVNYGFLITKNRRGSDIEPVWDERDHLIVTKEGEVEVQALPVVVDE